MAKKTAFVRMSGDLVGNENVIDWIRGKASKFFTVICVGGGKQINEAFEEKGIAIKFCPQGRIMSNFVEKKILRGILNKNQFRMERDLREKGILAKVIIPVIEIASVDCYISGDEFARIAVGYDKIYILTLKDRMEEKMKKFHFYQNVTIVGF